VLTRNQGRRIPLSKSVKDPTLDELTETARRLGYKPEPNNGKYPKRMMIPSGYVSVEKKSSLTKSQLIAEFAKTLSIVRGERNTVAEKDQHQRLPQKRH